MNKLFTRTREFIFTQQTSMFSSTLILAGMTILSRVAGFLRYRILGGYFSPVELDIFYGAFRVPDLVFEILVSGALSTTFIPFFVHYQKKDKHQGEIISSIINMVLITVGAFILILVVFLPFIMPLIAPGFDPDKMKTLILYSRIILIGQLPFIVLGNFLTAISQAKKSFLIPALAPIFYNLTIIVFVVLLAPSIKLLAPIYGIVAGAAILFIIQTPVFYISKFEYKLAITNYQETWKFFKAAIPRIITVIVAQIDATVDLSLSSLIGPGSYTIFFLAQRLQLLPVSVIGISFGQASLPYLTDIYQEKKYKEFKKIIIDSILNIFYFTIPAAAFLIIARTPLVRLFFGGDKFDWSATVLTAITLSYFALSLPQHSIYYFLTRCYYAIFDTRTPFYISGISIVIGAGLSIFLTLVLHMPVWALAISFSITMTVRVFLLMIILHKRLGGFDIVSLLKDSVKILIAALNTTVITYFLMRLLDGLIFDTSRTINVFFLLLTGFGFFATLFLFLSWLFGIKEMYILTKMLLKVKEYRQKILEVYNGVE